MNKMIAENKKKTLKILQKKRYMLRSTTNVVWNGSE